MGYHICIAMICNVSLRTEQFTRTSVPIHLISFQLLRYGTRQQQQFYLHKVI